MPKRRLKKISVYLPEPLLKGLNRMAEEKGIGIAVLLRMWIVERARAEGVFKTDHE